jgi:hypothetical protein
MIVVVIVTFLFKGLPTDEDGERDLGWTGDFELTMAGGNDSPFSTEEAWPSLRSWLLV